MAVPEEKFSFIPLPTNTLSFENSHPSWVYFCILPLWKNFFVPPAEISVAPMCAQSAQKFQNMFSIGGRNTGFFVAFFLPISLGEALVESL